MAEESLQGLRGRSERVGQDGPSSVCWGEMCMGDGHRRSREEWRWHVFGPL